jgi:DNA-binding transcriptional LysR family regulator
MLKLVDMGTLTFEKSGKSCNCIAFTTTIYDAPVNLTDSEPGMDQLRAIEYFVKVAELGSFTAAARAVGVPASSVSRRVQDLEAHLGTTLLNRTTRSVSLTELGSVYLEQVRPALKSLDHAKALINDRPSAPSGLLRITANPGYGRVLLMPAIHKLRAKYPDLIIDVELTDQVYNLASHEVDIAIRATADLPDRAIARKLADSTMKLVASPAYLAAHGAPRRLEDLAAHPTLMYRGPNRLIDWHAKTEAGWQDVQTHPVFICNVGRELVEQALAGAGLGLFFGWGIQPELASGELVEVTMEDASLSITRSESGGIYLLYNQPKYRLNKIKATVDFLLQELLQSG